MRIGVIVGRFQVPELHEGHKELIEAVIQEFDSTFILIGTTKDGQLTLHDPFPFEAREAMILETYPEVGACGEIKDIGNWGLWVKELDNIISSMNYPAGSEFYICGSRDSVVDHYTEFGGKHKTWYIKPNGKHSGTEERKNFTYTPEWTLEDRKMLLWTLKRILKS